MKKIIEVCSVRHIEQNKALTCAGCFYNGKTCEHAKMILKVDKPYEYKSQTKNK